MTTLMPRSLDALLLLWLLGCGLLGMAMGQVPPGKTAAPAISGNWAIGSIRTADVTPAQVKKLLGPDYDDVGVTVCDYAFADIAGDGFYRLLVTVDVSGRRFCNDLEIIAQDGTAQGLFVDQVDHIVDILVKGDGHDVLRLPQDFTDYEGYRCRAIVPIYYKFSGGKFVTATAEHAADYQALREKLKSSPPTDVCKVVETDKVDRLLGDKTAGFSHAKEWMTSPDESLRMKAVWVFKDIGDADSQAALKILATDKDPGVAMEASAYLQKLEQK